MPSYIGWAKKMLDLKPEADLPAGLEEYLHQINRNLAKVGASLVSRQIVAAAVSAWFSDLE